MKKHSISSLTRGLVVALALLSPWSYSAYADNPAEENDRIAALDELSNEELISSVPLGKHAELIRAFQGKEAKRLLKDEYTRAKGCDVEMYRNHEVIIISIPAARLFAPNSVKLSEEAAAFLNPVKRYVKTGKPDMYRVLLIMHTDNTGSTSYTDNLSLSRVEAVYDCLDNAGADTRYIFPTAAGATDPLVPNNTVGGRAKNRRLEIYLIPGKRMLEAAKKGRIAF